MAGAVNAVLASPGKFRLCVWRSCELISDSVEMFKVRMQGQYGSKDDKRLRTVATEMWKQWGFRKGIMRGYWVSLL